MSSGMDISTREVFRITVSLKCCTCREKTKVGTLTLSLLNGKRPIKVPNYKSLRLSRPPSHEEVKEFLSKGTVLKVDLF